MCSILPQQKCQNSINNRQLCSENEESEQRKKLAGNMHELQFTDISSAYKIRHQNKPHAQHIKQRYYHIHEAQSGHDNDHDDGPLAQNEGRRKLQKLIVHLTCWGTVEFQWTRFTEQKSPNHFASADRDQEEYKMPN